MKGRRRKASRAAGKGAPALHGPLLPGAGASWETEPSPNQEGDIKGEQVGKEKRERERERGGRDRQLHAHTNSIDGYLCLDFEDKIILHFLLPRNGPTI